MGFTKLRGGGFRRSSYALESRAGSNMSGMLLGTRTKNTTPRYILRARVKGDKELGKLLKRAGSANARKVAILALKATGKRYRTIVRDDFLNGQAVRRITGTYRNSIKIIANYPWRVRVGSSEPRAAALEFGYPPKNQKNRPHFKPALRKFRREIPDLWAKAYADIMRGRVA